MKITVYVPCHNNQDTVGQTLASLRQQTRPADQFLFINDRCTDNSAQIARENNFRVIQMPGKKGLAAARNCALANAQGDVILGVDADVVVAENYLQQLENRFASMPDIAAIGGRLDERFTDTRADLWRAIHLPQHFGPDELRDPRILFGATMACRVSVARQLGGWNERFISSFEDVDISNRVKAAGYHLLYAPACQAWHLRRDTDDSVLHNDWKWNYVGYEQSVSDLGFWLDHRLPHIWNRYRIFRVDDLPYPSLGTVTLRAAWGWIIRDLYVLRKSAPEVGHVPDVIKLARTVVMQYGMSAAAAESLLRWLNQLAASLEDPVRQTRPLLQEIADRVYTGAMQSIPDSNYWQNHKP
jgi:GT2 family glycosyltransferase